MLSLVVVKRNYETGATVKVLAVILRAVLNESKIGSRWNLVGAKKVTDHKNNDHSGMCHNDIICSTMVFFAGTFIFVFMAWISRPKVIVGPQAADRHVPAF